MADSHLATQRLGTRHYVSENSRGARLEIGDGPGQWTPGELLKIALLGCNVLSADQRLAAALGDDFEMAGVVAAETVPGENRYGSLSVELLPDFGDLDAQAQQALIECVMRAIDRRCTIGRTLDYPVPHQTVVSTEGLT